MALADVFDALVSKRCYKEIFSYDEAFTIIKDSIGTHFDPTLGKIFISCRKSLEKLYDDIG
jgi:response regulator RpfG family c-di-GMP phosphodiesterase